MQSSSIDRNTSHLTRKRRGEVSLVAPWRSVPSSQLQSEAATMKCPSNRFDVGLVIVEKQWRIRKFKLWGENSGQFTPLTSPPITPCPIPFCKIQLGYLGSAVYRPKFSDESDRSPASFFSYISRHLSPIFILLGGYTIHKSLCKVSANLWFQQKISRPQ